MDVIQDDDVALALIGYDVLTLDQCSRLARINFKFGDVRLLAILEDHTISYEEKKVKILIRWKEAKGGDATAVALAEHLSSLSLSPYYLKEAESILKVPIPSEFETEFYH